jgi:hypothetical protein
MNSNKYNVLKRKIKNSWRYFRGVFLPWFTLFNSFLSLTNMILISYLNQGYFNEKIKE